MARWQPIQLVGGSYADDALPWTHQDTINYIPVPAEKEGVRSRAILRCAPGFGLICDLGTNAPIRGARNVEGRLFVVSGTTLFQISSDGVPAELGTIPGVKRCSLSHNQITGGNEVVISNGQSGYVYNTATGTLEQITDESFIGSISFEFMDGYILGIEPKRRFAYTSDLADATSYNSIDRYEAEGSPDLLVGQAVTHREWWLMGERTIELFVNTGAATGTFQRSQGTVIEVGLAATHAVAAMDNSLFWLGSDGIVYRANGFTPQRISTHAIEQAIARCNMAQAFAFTFEDRGHKVFYLTFPDGQTWGYDAATGEWHRRKSHNLDRWRINTLTKWNGAWVAGDYSNGCLYQLDWNMQSEDGVEMERRRITGVTHDNQNALIINGLELVMDTGNGLGAGSHGLAKPLRKLTLTGDLGDGLQREAVSYQYTIAGGWRPATVAVISGALPDGLSISPDGLVTGTRGAAGSYSWQLRATDLGGNTAVLSDSSVTESTDIVTFATVNDGLAQTPYCSAVSDPVILVGVNNGNLLVSSNQGSTWATKSGLFSGAPVWGAARFNGKWYIFDGSKHWQSAGDDLVFSAKTNTSFAVANGSTQAANNALFAGEFGASPSKLWRMDTDETWASHSLGGSYGDPTSTVWTGTAYLVGTSTGKVLRSTDLTTWTLVHSFSATNTNARLAYLNGVLVACVVGGSWSRSTDDGLTWSADASSPSIGYVTATNTMFIGGRTLTLRTSTDGLTWGSAYTATNGSQFVGPWATDGLVFAAPIQSSYCVVGTNG